jgi:hypothetical protein
MVEKTAFLIIIVVEACVVASVVRVRLVTVVVITVITFCS